MTDLSPEQKAADACRARAISHPLIQGIVEQLVDLSRRNPSLNFKPTKSSLTFVGNAQSYADRLPSQVPVRVADFIGSEPTPDQLKTLRKLFDRSRLLREERGIEVLHITLGLLNWSEGRGAKPFSAPILLLPVELTKAGDAYSLKRVDGADLEINRALLEYLKRSPSGRLKEIDLGDELNFATAADWFAKALPPDAAREIDTSIHLGLFSYEKLVMVDDIEANAETILEHPIISALNGNAEPLALMQHGIEFPTNPELDFGTVDPNRVFVVEADSSQQESLEAVARGLSLVIQGPPGTGKSQTIVNLIAQAMFDGKSVLFVAEKKVALDVVLERLRSCGLGDAALAVQRDADKKAFMAMLGRRHAELTSSNLIRTPYRNVSSSVDELNAYRNELHEPLGSTPDSAYVLYGRQSRHLKDTPAFRIEHAEKFNRDERENLAETIERLASNPLWLRKPHEAVWSSLLPNISELSDIHQRRDGMVDGKTYASGVVAIAEAAQEIVGVQVGFTDEAIDILRSLLLLVADSPVVPARWLDSDSRSASVALDRYCAERLAYQTDKASLLGRYQDGVFESDVDRLAEKFLGEYEKFWKRWFNKGYVTDVSEVLKQRLDEHRRAVYGELRGELDLIRKVKHRRAQWASEAHEMHAAFGSLFNGVDTEPEVLRNALIWFKEFEKIRARTPIDPVLAATLTSAQDAKRVNARNLHHKLQVAQDGIAATSKTLSEIFCDVPADRSQWIKFLGNKLDAIEEAPRYCQYRKWIADARGHGCGKLLDAVRDDLSMEPEEWRAIFERVFDASLIDYAHRTKPALAAFDRENHERLRGRYAVSDQENVDTGGRRVAERISDIARSHMDSEEYRQAIELITAQASRVRNVMPIRKVTRQAFGAIRVLKSCWMMSPLAVSQYLPPGPVFDLVVFDEASQMRPADAIAALSRAKQVVVVGDNKQLPPSSFFDNAVVGDSEEEEESEDQRSDISDYESILDRCASVVQQRMLRWHYRSRHESLISFSNHEFYEDRLVTFPTPAFRAGLGVRLVKVESTYARAASRQNRGEADEVARVAFQHAKTRPNETLGIIAFSQTQQRAIEDAIERLREVSNDAAAFFSDARPANQRVFVKNLESVQGDERDVIILSVGYGRDETGKLSYNFGPLNRAGGGRRLNVAVTRAKNEMIVVSSIDDRDLDAEKCREGGPKIVRSYLAYARAGGSILGLATATGRGVDSPFEEDVRLVLQDAGFKVHLQVGASGYRIDLAICHPEREGEYVLAVECDGATYHGTPTARDRDRLRDRTLKTFGWRIHRIWSRDWFRRRSNEIDRLVAAAHAAINESNEAALVAASNPPAVAAENPISVEPAYDDRAKMLEAAMRSVEESLTKSQVSTSKKDLATSTRLPESLVGEALERLIAARVVEKIGIGRGTKYRGK